MNDDLITRATQALYRRTQGTHEVFQQPDSRLSEVVEDGGHTYIVLRNINGLLAVYLVYAGPLLTWLDPSKYPDVIAAKEYRLMEAKVLLETVGACKT